VVAAAKRLGLRRIGGGEQVVGADEPHAWRVLRSRRNVYRRRCAEVMGPDKFQKISTGDHMDLAHELGRQGPSPSTRTPDGLYIGGGSWLSEPVCPGRSSASLGKPAISNQSCMIWDTLTRLGAWNPIPGQGRLLSVA